jgi:hypothetical protein
LSRLGRDVEISDPLLGALLVAILAGLVEALLLWLVLEDLRSLLNVFAVTLGAIMLTDSATLLRNYGTVPQRVTLQRYALGAFLLNLVLFGAVVVLIGKRAEGRQVWIWAEFLVLSVMTLSTFGTRAFIRESIR